MTPYPPLAARAALVETIASVRDLAAMLTDEQLLRPSRAAAWTVGDVLCHVHLGAQELLVVLTQRTDRPADTDFVAYWRPWQPGGAAVDAHARFVRNLAAAYTAPTGLVTHMTPTLDACIRRASEVEVDRRLAWQGRVLPVGDLLATWTVEFAVHHLDITVELQDAPAPPLTALRLAAETLDRLLGEPAPTDWTVTEHVLKGTGRGPLSAEDRRVLGSLAARFPLLG